MPGRLLASLVAALLTTSCAAPTVVSDRRRSAPPGDVLLIGDSILVGARDYGDLEARLSSDGWVPEVVAEPSKTIGWALEVLGAREQVPRAVVIVLGSNPGAGTVGFADEVGALREALAERGATTIAWVPPTHADPERYAARAQIITEADGVRVLDWPSQVNTEWFSGDGLHLSSSGYAALAAFIVDAL